MADAERPSPPEQAVPALAPTNEAEDASLEEAEEESLLEEVEQEAREQLGMRAWDRPAVLEEAASKATEADIPYWTILVISGAIATLGVTLDNSAVVIGAMLIAPVLAPIVGLGLSLAAGDGRLAAQTASVVLASMMAVVAVAALLTFLLPFRSITTEIASRTRPTTLDLAIAIFSGLAAAVVTVARRSGLAAALPGVAISVALIPPLAVVGFGIGAGWRWPLIKGSLLLVGANLAGIVLSAVIVFFLVGMHRIEVRQAARQWHQESHPTGLAAWIGDLAWVRRLGEIRSPVLRLGLVFGFVAAVAVPLSGAFTQLTRETRVQRAVNQAAQLFEDPGRSSVLEQQVVQQEDQSRVFLRVATSEWYDEEAKEQFEREAERQADEPVELVLEQLLASAGDLEQVAEMLPSKASTAAEQERTLGAPASALQTLVDPARQRLRKATGTLSLPAGASLLAEELLLTDQGDIVVLHYTAGAPLPAEAQEIIGTQLAKALEAPDLQVRLHYVAAGPIVLAGSATDTAAVRRLAEASARYDSLGAVLLAGTAADSAQVASARAFLQRFGLTSPVQVERAGGSDSLRVRLR